MQTLQHGDVCGAFFVLTTAMIDGMIPFIYCYFGKLATDCFAQMSNDLFEANWVELPVSVQKYFVIMIENAQRPLHYHGFRMVYLNLETFAKVSTFLIEANNIRFHISIHISLFSLFSGSENNR